MAGLILDGINLAKQIEQELAHRIHKIKQNTRESLKVMVPPVLE